jgi:hypothetical protein
MDQKKAGEKMGISRATVQRLLTKGRKKMINALVQKKALAVVPTRNTYAVGGGYDTSTGMRPVAGRCDQSSPCSGASSEFEAPGADGGDLSAG